LQNALDAKFDDPTGTVSQYVRGDGSLANFPASTGGGGSLSYYLNGSVAQGTFGGIAMKEMDRTPVLGAGTDFTIATNGYIQSFITDANVPNQLEIPAGNWNFETYFSASSLGGTPSFYIELYKWDGATLSLISSGSANPEGITNGTATHLYVSALAVPQTALTVTDRLAIRIYVNNSGRTIKLHTENSNLSQVITTFSTGMTALNGLTAQVQNLATGTSGTDFGISSATSTHTFNLPTASATNRGALSSADWTTFNNKQAALVSGTNIKTVNGTTLLGSGDLVAGLPAWVENNATDLTIWNNGKGNIVSNTSFGDLALRLNTTGTNNTAYGYNSLVSNTTGTGNTTVGVGAGRLIATTSNNTYVGLSSGANTVSSQNTGIGSQSLMAATTGADNSAIGNTCLFSLTTGSGNCGIGHVVGLTLTTGSNNTLLGRGANVSVAATSNSVVVGRNSRANTGSIVIGSDSTATFTDSIIIGRGADATANNQFIVGSSTYNAGAVTTETVVTTRTWSVIINGVARKILLA
jgi:hypothetical protein